MKAGERVVLFDGTGVDGWRMAGPGSVELVDGALESRGGMGRRNHFAIEHVGQRYNVVLDGLAVTRFTGSRATEGFVGLQNHDADSLVRFRRVTVTTIN